MGFRKWSRKDAEVQSIQPKTNFNIVGTPLRLSVFARKKLNSKWKLPGICQCEEARLIGRAGTTKQSFEV